MTPGSRPSRAGGVFRLALAVVAVSVFVHLYLDNAGHFLGRETDRLVAGEHRRPFVYRVLTPLLIRGGISALPERTVHRLNFSARGDRPRRLAAMVGYEWSGDRGEVFLLVYLIAFLCAAVLYFSFRGLLRSVGEPPGTVEIGPLLVLLALPVLYTKSGMPYDLPELALFCLGLHLCRRGKWVAYYAVFALSVLNKETGILMVAYLLPWWFAGERRRLGKHAALHAAIAVPILVGIRVAYAGSPGTAIDVNLAKNLAYFVSPEPWFKFADVYAHQVPFPRAFNLLFLLLLLGPLWAARRSLPADLTVIAKAMAFALLPLFLLFGNQDEIRVFAPVAPAVALLLVRAASVLLSPPRGVLFDGTRAGA